MHIDVIFDGCVYFVRILTGYGVPKKWGMWCTALPNFGIINLSCRTAVASTLLTQMFVSLNMHLCPGSNSIRQHLQIQSHINFQSVVYRWDLIVSTIKKNITTLTKVFKLAVVNATSPAICFLIVSISNRITQVLCERKMRCIVIVTLNLRRATLLL